MRTRTVALAGVLAALPLLLACASPQAGPETPPVTAAASEKLPPLSDIRECLFSSRRPDSKGLTSRMVRPDSYNDCMRAKGWRSSSASRPAPPSKG